VLKARSSDDGESRDALAVLCQAYWSPVFLYIKQRGHDAEAARDLTQGFFAALLEKKGIAEARQERGRFRTFLLTAVKNFLANEHDFRTAQKRGGGQAPISIEADEWNATMAIVEPATHLTPEVLYEKRWRSWRRTRSAPEESTSSESSAGTWGMTSIHRTARSPWTST
jgi:RNA polymerase sigma-70 factor (ECF subfamily)